MINFFPVNQLRDRYQIAKQSEINRRKHLKIVPVKVEGIFCVNKEQLEQLDLLHSFLQTPGAKMADFQASKIKEKANVVPLSLEATIIPETDSNNVDRDQPSDWLVYIEAIARAIQPTNPISHWEKLKWAAESGILLSTKEIFQILGTKPKLKSGQTTWQRGSFSFKKVGKIGSSSAWLVSQTKVGSDKQSDDSTNLSAIGLSPSAL